MNMANSKKWKNEKYGALREIWQSYKKQVGRTDIFLLGESR